MSEASPATGAEASAKAGADEASQPSKPKRSRREAVAGPTSVSLEHSRWRTFAWAAAGLFIGAVLVWKLGSVGKGVGVVLIGVSLWAGRSFVLTLMNEPGSIHVDQDDITLPRGLCRSAPVTLTVKDLRHAYFLRRAVPWTRTGPLLVVETDRGVFQYPRDWFATDSDQRRIAAALNHRLGRL